MSIGTKLWRRIFWAALGASALAAVGLLLAICRGFRAVEPPGALETAVARRVRDLAIPWHEQRAKNPLAGDAAALEQGHELFLANCATCHGVDGSGKTRIGTNLYPRVPDLRAAPTQSLSDGEIHFIISNGVRFTGMPAMDSVHRGQNLAIPQSPRSKNLLRVRSCRVCPRAFRAAGRVRRCTDYHFL